MHRVIMHYLYPCTLISHAQLPRASRRSSRARTSVELPKSRMRRNTQHLADADVGRVGHVRVQPEKRRQGAAKARAEPRESVTTANAVHAQGVIRVSEAINCFENAVRAAILAHMFPTTSRLLSVKMRSGSASRVFMLNSRRQFESPANTCAMYCNVSPLAPQYLGTCGKRR